MKITHKTTNQVFVMKVDMKALKRIIIISHKKLEKKAIFRLRFLKLIREAVFRTELVVLRNEILMYPNPILSVETIIPNVSTSVWWATINSTAFNKKPEEPTLEPHIWKSSQKNDHLLCFILNLFYWIWPKTRSNSIP